MITQLWERQPKESAIAYEGFKAYLDLGPERTLIEAYRRRTGRKDGTPTGGFRRMAKEHNWPDRARAWDRNLDQAKQRGSEAEAYKAGEIWENRRQENLEANWRLSQQLHKQAERLAQMPVTRITKSDDGAVTVIEAVSPNTLAKAATVAKESFQIAWAVLREALPEGDDGFDVSKATKEELQNYLDRANERRRKSA